MKIAGLSDQICDTYGLKMMRYRSGKTTWENGKEKKMELNIPENKDTKIQRKDQP